MKTRLGSMSPAGDSFIPPTVEFPSQRRERVDWHKLASVDLHDLASGCSIEFLQENLSQVAFCDAESEFDVTTAVGQRSLFKMFRLAQLIIQYLFLSQEYLENQLCQCQDEVQQFTEKYQQVKTKLLQQVEEAKKMKATNKSMRETVKYVNSVALANGLFQPSKCPLCCKTFRSQEFLQSHLWRKHPNQASAVVLPQAPIVLPAENKHIEVPSTVPEISARTQESTRSNDVDAFRILDIEKKFDMMNDNFNKLMKDMENQKYTLERDNEKHQEEVKKAWEEKQDLEKGYEVQLNRLTEHISHMQVAGKDQSSVLNNERLVEHIRKQDSEINALRFQIEDQLKNMTVEEKENGDVVDSFSNELKDLKRQLQEQKKNHRHSIAQIQDSLRKEYEGALKTEKTKLSKMMEDIAHQESTRKAVSKKPPPSLKTSSVRKPPLPDKSTKSPTKSLDLYEDSVHTFSYSGSDTIYGKTQHLQSDSESESETDTSQWNQSNLKIQQLRITSTDNDDDQTQENDLSSRDSESESESEGSYSKSEEDTINGEEETSESLTLDTLLKENPQLWMQMKKATSEVLASKLSMLGVDSSVKGIKSEVLTSCLSHLRKERKMFEDKYDQFYELRRKLENEVTAKLDDKIEDVGNISGTHAFDKENKTSTNQRNQSGVLSKVVRNVRSKVKESSKAFSTSVSKTSESVKTGVKDIFQADSKSGNVQVISDKKSRLHKHRKKTEVVNDSSSSESEPEDSTNGSAQVEVHNETLKSVSRNLFGDDPLPGKSGIQPKKGNFFENKTYGQVDEEDLSGWDSGSDPEYENVKKAEPPKRTDSLHVSNFSGYPSASTNNWDLAATEAKPIKLKKPSGDKVSTLSRTIELQLSGRKKNKMAGAIDIMTGLPGSSLEPPGSLVSTPAGSHQHIPSVSESSNTFGTSLWGSAEAVNRNDKRNTKATSNAARLQSWDSEDDLEISEIE